MMNISRAEYTKAERSGAKRYGLNAEESPAYGWASSRKYTGIER